MKTGKKIIDAYIVTICKRGEIIDESFKPNDVQRVTYIENNNGYYDIHYYQGGNCVHKEYGVLRDALIKRFKEWKSYQEFPNFYKKDKIVEYTIQYV
jgi:hypothetical protein